MADTTTEVSRYTVWTVSLMVLATLLTVAIGVVGAALWLPNTMSFAPSFDAAPDDRLELGIFLFLSAGPVIAGLGLIVGWLSFIFFRAPRMGVKLVFYPPVIWGVAMLAYFAVVTTACGGDFTCGV